MTGVVLFWEVGEFAGGWARITESWLRDSIVRFQGGVYMLFVSLYRFLLSF